MMLKNSIPQIHISNTLNLNNSRSTSPNTIDYDSPRTPPKPEVMRRNLKPLKHDDELCMIESSSQFHSSTESLAKFNTSKDSYLSSRRLKNSKRYPCSYGRNNSNELKIPEARTGYIYKQCQLFSNVRIKRYFLLEKGILSNFKTDIDHNNKDIQESRRHKQIDLKIYKLACDTSNQKLTLLAMDRSNNNIPNNTITTTTTTHNQSRQSLILYFNNKEMYQSWEQAIKLHSIYANQPKSNSSRFEELKLISTILLNCDIETFNESENRGSSGSGSFSSSERLNTSNSNNDSIITRNPNEIEILKKSEPFLKSCKSTGRSSFMSISNIILEEEEEKNEE